MAQDDERNKASGSSRPGRQPPVIDLEASEVGKPEDADQSHSAATGETSGTADIRHDPAMTDRTASTEGEASPISGQTDGSEPQATAAAAEDHASTPRDHLHYDEEAADLEPLNARDSELASLVRGGIAVLLVVAGLLGGILVYRYYGTDYFPTPEMSDALAKLPAMEQTSRENRDRLDTFSETVESFKTRLNGLDEGMVAVRQNMANLQAAIDDTRNLAQRANTAATEAREAAASTGDQGAPADLGPIQADIASINDRIGTLDAQLGTIRDSVNQTAGGSEAMQALISRQAALEEKIQGRIEADAQAATRQAENASAIAAAIENLRARLGDGQPYKAEMDQLRGSIANSPAFDRLNQFAEAGVPTAATLAQRFDEVRKALTKAPTEAPVEKGTWDALAARLKEVVQIHPVGEIDWSEVGARMAGPAQAGDLNAAIRIGEAAGGTPPQQLAAWLDAARARISADDAFSTLTSQALERLRTTQSSGN